MPAPTLTGFAPSITLAENTVNATPQLLDADVVFTDIDEDFDGGSLTLSGLLAEDVASVRNEGTDAGQIGVSGTDITYGGVVIGTLAGGVGATLTITFNAAANSAAIDALIQNLTYANTSNTPTASRTMILNVTDAGGGALPLLPSYAMQTGAASPFDGIDIGGNSSPALADLDGDGDLDLVAGDQLGALVYFENTGTAVAPVYESRPGAANPFDGVGVGTRSAPFFADIDGDGDLDAIVGEQYSPIKYFENTGTAAAPVFVARSGGANPFDGLNSGYRTTPVLADLDNDGDLDMMMGEAFGGLRYFQNTGTTGAPVYVARTGAANPFDGVDLGSDPHPDFADVDADGDLDAVVGDFNGLMHYFENTGTAAAGVFVERTGAANPFNGVDVGYSAQLDIADVNGDGRLDIVVGSISGGLTYFLNTSVNGAAITVGVTAESDAPVLDLNGVEAGSDNAGSYTENDPALTLAPDALLTDDGGTMTGATIQITGGHLPSLDYLMIDGSTSGSRSGISFSFDASTGVLTLTGNRSVTSYQNVLRLITFESYSDQPGSGRTISWTVNEGALTSTTVTTTIAVTPVEDAPFAGDDYAYISETDTVSASVFGNDGDADSPIVLTVSEVNGDADSVGTQITLPSGALLTLNADGSYDYDPNGAFSHLAVDVMTTDSFTYAIPGGNTATVTIYITGEDGAGDVVQGDSGDNTVDGGDGDDTVVGGGGNDALIGGDGVDTADYGGAAAGVAVFMNGGVTTNDGDGGADTLAGIENLTGSGFDDILVGAGGDNTIQGGAGTDVLIGLDGDDTLIGGSGVANQLQGGMGDDVYIVEANDTVVEFLNQGHDKIFTTRDRMTLVANVEELHYVGSSDFTGTGNALNNVIASGSANDVLYGAGGDDILHGGGGIDAVSYANAAAAVIASLTSNSAAVDGDGGVDSFVDIENLIGSAFGDALTGSAGANTLSGGGGDDILAGAGGNDLLQGGIGADFASYDLAASGVIVRLDLSTAQDGDGGADTLSAIENISGSAYADLIIGNALGNILAGQDGADVLIGRDGDDLLVGGSGAANEMYGGEGDDTYSVEANDTIVELAGQGTDRVETIRNQFTLSANIENLAFTGTGNFAGAGNASANDITGGDGLDTLTGGGGDDTLNGGLGRDTARFSGVASDYTVVSLGGGQYRVTDTVGGRDGVDILTDIEQVSFSDGIVALSNPAPAAPLLSAKQIGDAQVLPDTLADDFLVYGDEGPLVLPSLDDAFEARHPVFSREAGFNLFLSVDEGQGVSGHGLIDTHGHDHWML